MPSRLQPHGSSGWCGVPRPAGRSSTDGDGIVTAVAAPSVTHVRWGQCVVTIERRRAFTWHGRDVRTVKRNEDDPTADQRITPADGAEASKLVAAVVPDSSHPWGHDPVCCRPWKPK